MTDGPRALYRRIDANGRTYDVWQTPQQAFEYDRRERGLSYALREWYSYRETIATWVYCVATGNAPVLMDGPDDEGEWN